MTARASRVIKDPRRFSAIFIRPVELASATRICYGCCAEWMKRLKLTLPIIVAAVTTVLVLGIGGWMTTVGPWYENLIKPTWNPPNWIFGPAWTVILALAAWAGVLAWTNASDRTSQLLVLALFGVNIFLHMLWSPLSFNLKRPDWALLEIPFLWLSIAALMFGLAPLSPTASWLLVPYLLWVTFAAFLNLTIVRLNRPFGETTWKPGK
jgi:benzodiazapine receptor